MFEDLMNGLDEVDAFLAGETFGYKASVPTEADETPNAVIAALHPQLVRHHAK